ncbi:MAG TPA: DUF192 domain-containing protein [Patescibacteria group bacterium]
MKKIIWTISVLIFLSGAFFLFQRKNAGPRYSASGNVLEKIRIGGGIVEVEVVSTGEKRVLGLSGRDSMCGNCGMLFVFGSGDQRRFWMKDMEFDLDMLWIMDGKVVYIARNVSHENGTDVIVTAENVADKVLELNAGASDRLGIRVGDTVI